MSNQLKFVEEFNTFELKKKITTLFNMIGHRSTSDFHMECFKEIVKIPENAVLFNCFKEVNRLFHRKYPNSDGKAATEMPFFIKEIEKLYRKNPYIIGENRNKGIEQILNEH